MFGFGKKKDIQVPKKKHSALDKILMGAIVGGAIGSVVGMTIAPKKGSETREIIAQKGKELYQKGQDVATKLQHKSSDDKTNNQVDTPEQKKFFGRLIDKFKSNKKNKQGLRQTPMPENHLKKIPHEVKEM